MAKPDIHIEWRTVAIGSLLLNLGAIGVVATIATVHDSNTLATIALALAIIAFISELIIFSVQTWQSGEQLKQAERLNSATSSLLADMRTRLEGTHQMVTTQYQELLHLAVLKADATDAKGGTTSTGRRVAEVVRDIMPTVESENPATHIYGTKEASLLLRWPNLQDARRAIELLEPLTDNQLNAFMADVILDSLSRLDETTPTLNKTKEVDQPLIDVGLVADVLIDRKQEPDKIQLTERGRVASRVLIPSWPPPNSLGVVNDAIWSIRTRMDPQATALAERARASLVSFAG